LTETIGTARAVVPRLAITRVDDPSELLLGALAIDAAAQAR